VECCGDGANASGRGHIGLALSRKVPEICFARPILQPIPSNEFAEQDNSGLPPKISGRPAVRKASVILDVGGRSFEQTLPILILFKGLDQRGRIKRMVKSS